MTLVLIEVADEAAMQQLRFQQGVRVVGVVVEESNSNTVAANPTETQSDESVQQMPDERKS